MKKNFLIPSVSLTENNDKILAAAALGKTLAAIENGGGDGILLWGDAKHSTDDVTQVLCEAVAAVDIPVMFYQVYPRFEDIKKIIYAGASKAVMNPLEGGGRETLKEGVARFGSENVYGTFMTVSEERFPSPEDFREIVVFTGCKSWVMDMAAMERYDTVINEQELNLLACARESLSGDAIKEILLMPQVIGFTALDISSQVPGDIAGINDCMALKDYLRSEGMEICLFESSISFEDFKLNSDGLIPVITQDYKTGKVLMMAYMNEESYNETIRSGRMSYFSRSRQCLWKKGETSGHYQFVRSLEIDCDKDTILAKVRQIGAACHTGHESCFFTNLARKEYVSVNPSTILQEIMDTVTDRKLHPKEGSYTNYLFEKGIDKILKKVGEEATEIVIAAKNPDAGELKYEIADFLYHMIVLMAEKEVSWDEICEELAKRH